MELPKSMTIMCDFGGNVLQKPDDLKIKSIFDIFDEKSLPLIHDYIKKMFVKGEYISLGIFKLYDSNDYYINTDILNGKICFMLNRFIQDESKEANTYWTNVTFKYEYYIKRQESILKSLSNIVEKIFYKNRSNIGEVIKSLHSSLNLKYSMLLFRNGHDHIMYCKNLDISSYDLIKNDNYQYEDSKFDENVITKISDIMIIKKYKDTYIKDFIKEDKDYFDKNVYILKLTFGTRTIGYFEFMPYSYIMFTPTEIDLIRSLSNILAYIIHNKNEQMDIENYINSKLK